MSLPPPTAVYLGSSLLLGAAGLAKLRRPDETARALAAAGLKGSRRAVRALAAAEAAVCAGALVDPGALTGSLVALCYLAFAGFVAAAIRAGWPLSSCGCFAKPDTAPGPVHLVLDCGAAAFALWWTAWCATTRSAPEVLSAGHPARTAYLSLVSAVVALLGYLVWTDPARAVRGRRA